MFQLFEFLNSHFSNIYCFILQFKHNNYVKSFFERKKPILVKVKSNSLQQYYDLANYSYQRNRIQSTKQSYYIDIK